MPEQKISESQNRGLLWKILTINVEPVRAWKCRNIYLTIDSQNFNIFIKILKSSNFLLLF